MPDYNQLANSLQGIYGNNQQSLNPFGVTNIQRQGLPDNGMKQASQRMLATPIQGFTPPARPGINMNPFAVGASILGNIGGGYRANLGTQDVWQAGGVLQGTGVGNTMNAVGDAVSQIGPAGAIAGMALKGGADLVNLAKHNPTVSDIDTGDQFMQEGGPVLQIGDNISSAGEMMGNAKKMVGQGALAGAKTGGLIGAGIGALIGKGAKKRTERAYKGAMGEIDETTTEFNELNQLASQERFGRERLMSQLGREKNPYLQNTGNPFLV